MTLLYDETLYGKDKKEGVKVWNISVRYYTDAISEEKVAAIRVVHGKEGGKMQEKFTFIKEGKQKRSIGEQGVFEAQSKLNKQMDKGYRPTIEELDEVPLAAMLAQDYNKHGHRINYPAQASPKMDGVRCLAIREEGRVKLQSRGNKEFSVHHLEDALIDVMEVGEAWDGEIYVHGYELEDILSAVKRTDPDKEIAACERKLEKAKLAHEKAVAEYGEGSAETGLDLEEAVKELAHAKMIKELRGKLEFWVFDIVLDQPFKIRLEALKSLDACLAGHRWIKVLVGEEVESEEHLKKLHARDVDKGFEGEMVRNFSGMYESGKRSADLQKYKVMISKEFRVVEVVEDKNGNAVLKCWDDIANASFGVCYGDFNQRKHQLEHPELYVDHWQTVDFQKRYKDSRLPQFPAGKGFREGRVVGGQFIPNE